MKFGLDMIPTDESISPAELARAAEEHGFESLFFPEHTHVPMAMRSAYPASRDGALPHPFLRSLDPFVALSAAATATTRLRLGTGICLVVERDPITLAKQVASLDFVSEGRVLFGIGAGWNEEEMRNHGTEPVTRFRLLRERVQTMKQIWTEDEAEYHGEFVDFDPIWSWPKPVQQPHPPVILAGNGPSVLRRVVAYADEWWPFSEALDTLPARIPELQRLAAAAGRGPIPVTLMTANRDRATIERMEAAGVSRCIFRLPSAGPDEVLPLIAACADVAAAFA
jgi:probable F420-dependent oxidoreductase